MFEKKTKPSLYTLPVALVINTSKPLERCYRERGSGFKNFTRVKACLITCTKIISYVNLSRIERSMCLVVMHLTLNKE